MSKHTPGPWASNEDTTSVFVPLKAIDCERIGFSIGFVNGHREKEAAANARLIAVAPELLELLREAAGYTRHPDYDWPVEFSRRVDAAFAKATGEQQ